MDTAQWRPQQGIGLVKGVEGSERQQQVQVAERRVRPQKTQPLNCPRCDSTNTKFCYYNNYSLSQPRYFCKTCRRYWTEGGTLRNVPVGGGSRKNKRSSSSPSSTPNLASSTTPATKTTISLPSSSSTNPMPSHELNHLAYKFGHGGHDLNLSFPNQTLGGGHELGGGCLPAFELLRSGIFPRGLVPFVSSPMPPALGPLFGAGLGFQELIRPSPSNSKLQPLDGVCGGGYGAGSMQEGGDGRLLFPFEDLKLVPMRNESHEAAVHGQGDPTLFWNGVMGNGGGGSNGGAAGGSW